MFSDMVRVKDPLVPVTTSVWDPTLVGFIVKVEVPDPLMVVVLSETATPVGLTTLNATVDPNPFRRFRLIVEVPCPPVLIDRLDGFAERLKSRNVNVVVAVWVKLPLVPVTVSV